MWMEVLKIDIPGFFVTAATAFLGAPFLLIVWFGIAFEPPNHWQWKMPAALYAFAGATFSDSIGYLLLLNCPSAWYGLPQETTLRMIWVFTMIVGFVFVLVTCVLLLRYSGPGKRVLTVGSIILFVINLIGFMGYVAMLQST
jgi:hypothetical protein